MKYSSYKTLIGFLQGNYCQDWQLFWSPKIQIGNTKLRAVFNLSLAYIIYF